MLSDFKSRFAEQSRRLDDQLVYENDANKQLLQEKWEKDARKQFLRDISALGQSLPTGGEELLVQTMLERGYDLRIPGAWTVAYVAMNSEGMFEKLRVDAAEAAQAEEARSIKAPTVADKAPSSIRIEGNRTVVNRNDEEISAEQLAELTPDKLSKSTMKRLKFQAGVSRREHQSPQSEAAMDRGERTRI